MRISIIRSGGSGAFRSDGLGDLLGTFETHIERQRCVYNSFKQIRQECGGINGGVGALEPAVEALDRRIAEEEETINELTTVRNKTYDFLSHAAAVDNRVSDLIYEKRGEFFKEYPHLKPREPEERHWWQVAADFICDVAGGFVSIAAAAFEGLKNVASFVMNSIAEFYERYGKIINTVLIAVGAVLAIAAVIATGGVALAPLLGALGASAAVAETVSIAVAAAAVVSTIGAGVMNITDIWCDIDDPFFQGARTVFNVISGVSNFAYSVGGIYNSVTGVTGTEYLARESAKAPDKYAVFDAEHTRMRHKAGGYYDQTRKKIIYDHNREYNHGVLRSDQTGKILYGSVRNTKGVSPSPYSAQIDHIIPRSKGGFNSFENAQVIERIANIKKGDLVDFTEYFLYSKADEPSILSGLFFGIDHAVNSRVSSGQTVDSLIDTFRTESKKDNDK